MASEGYKTHLYVLSLVFFLLFAAYNTTQSLATTINADLGNAFLASLYASFCACSIFAPRLVTIFGLKASMAIGLVPYFFAILSFLIPSSTSFGIQLVVKIFVGIFCGMGAPLVWTGASLYTSRIAALHARAIRGDQLMEAAPPEEDLTEATRKMLADFNGIFYASFQANGFIGNAVAGITFLATSNVASAYTVIFLMLSAICVSSFVILLLFLKDVPPPEEALGDSNDASLTETFKLLCNSAVMKLFVPVIFYNGFSMGFIFGTMTSEGWRVAFGPRFPAFGTAWFYAINVLATMSLRKVAGSKKGQRLVMTVAFVSHLIFFLCFLVYNVPTTSCRSDGCNAAGSCFQIPGDINSDSLPTHCGGSSGTACANCISLNDLQNCPNNWHQCDILKGSAPAHLGTLIMLFFLVALFAIGDAVWESQVPSFLQDYFGGREADVNGAIANMKLWQSLGFAFEFALSLNGMPLGAGHFKTSAGVLTVMLLVSGVCLALADRHRQQSCREVSPF
eukprot:NODE_5054_length_1814_cov_6.389449.p1 GENE.NODE_5054_length_1814_cov_6.389449~~NODE_5054_length_1814_cov_6.389449.p1  ORF type:complete len:508 (-),score=136.75 NODE_5054_length_1814_cov_6.389449:166-1689(-)